MPNHRSNGAVVDRLVSTQIEERRLQNGGREHNLVEYWGVIGIHCLRVHAPLVAIDRPSMPSNVAFNVGFPDAHAITKVIILCDLDPLVLAEGLRVTNLWLKLRQLV